MNSKQTLEDLKKFTILYVEDNKEISEEVYFFLNMYVKKLYLAYDGLEGVEAFLKHKPDIIITDIQMPKMNGLDMISRIRESDIHIPIIVTTAFNEVEYLLKAINLHVDGYQIKPLNFKELIKSLEKIIEPMILKAEIKLKNAQIDENNYYLEQFKHAVDKASIFSVLNENGIITEVNRNFELISGYTKDELIGKPYSIVSDKNTSETLIKEMWDTIQSGKIWKSLITNKKKNGQNYYVISEIAPIYNKDGSFREYTNISNDVTELEEYKLSLKNELDTTHHNLDENLNYTQQYEAAINSTTAIVKTDSNNIIIYANEKFCELSGYTDEEILGVDSSKMRYDKYISQKKCQEIKEALNEKRIVHRIMTNISKNNDVYTVNNLFYPIVDLQGNVIEHLNIMHDLTEIMQLNEEITNTQKEVVLTLGAIGETRSLETGLHVKRVAEYSYLLAKLSGLNEEEASLLRQASPMHDIGKVGIPDSILNKPGALTDEEFEIMKTHAKIGYEMLKHSKRELLKASAIVAYTHHEKWNGSGYPNAIKGEEIHIYGRITAIADVFDALGHDRVYKKAWSLEDILAFFRRESGVHFEPRLIDLFIANLNEFIKIKDAMKNDSLRVHFQ